ncbi:Glycosyltransferase [Balamuthia mandrillaris]
MANRQRRGSSRLLTFALGILCGGLCSFFLFLWPSIPQPQGFELERFTASERTQMHSPSFSSTPPSSGMLAQPGLDAGGSLWFPHSKEPEISVVMLYKGRVGTTFKALQSILNTTPAHLSYEVILVDDFTTEEDENEGVPADWLHKNVHGVKHLRNDRNLGYLLAYNKAFIHVHPQARYLALLNNDLVLLPGWMEAMRSTFRKHANVGLVGSKLLHASESKKGTRLLQEACSIVWSDGTGCNYGYNNDPNLPEYNYVRDADYCSTAAVMIDTAPLFKAGQLFDTRYVPAYFEDTDLNFDLRNRQGLRVLFQPDAVAIHHQGLTNGNNPSDHSSIKRYQDINRDRFVEKWREVLERDHLPSFCSIASTCHLGRDRSVLRGSGTGGNGTMEGLRVLVIDYQVPTPDRDTGSLRISEIISILQEEGCAVTFAAEDISYENRYTRLLEQRGVQVLQLPFHGINERHREVHPYFDIVVLSRRDVFAKHYDPVRQVYPEAQLWFDTMDLHFVREARALQPLSLEWGWQKVMDNPLAVQELVAIKDMADLTFVVSTYEYELLIKEFQVPEAKVMILSLINEEKVSQPTFKERTGLIYVASYNHWPNVDAIAWYLRDVHPLVRRCLPPESEEKEGTLMIVGSPVHPAKLPGWVIHHQPPLDEAEEKRQMQEEQEKLRLTKGRKRNPTAEDIAAGQATFEAEHTGWSTRKDGYALLGFVEDTDPLYDRARLSIAPLRFGAGVKGKVSQSMAKGVPVVTTSIGAEGMGLVDGEDVLIADTAEGFADKVCRLHRLRANGMKKAEEAFSKRAARRVLAPLLAEVRVRGRASRRQALDAACHSLKRNLRKDEKKKLKMEEKKKQTR